jgi:large subunit ribosomal protein L22
MTGPKLNEASYVAGERSGTKASAKYVRVSAYKARVVLDLIRGLPVRRADEVLQFTDREVSNDIRKVLASAVANAIDTNSSAYIGEAEELFVKACFADEGPTLKRFRPRAKGRASRIRKRTCHITVLVARLDDAKIEIVANREARRTAAGRRRAAAGGSEAASRAARVARSRQRAAGLKAGDTPSDSDADTEVEDTEVHGFAETAIVSANADVPAGAVPANEDGSQPEGYDIKGNADSGLYHVPGSRFYDRTVAEFWFATAEDAEAAGFLLPPSQRDDDDATDGDAAEESN